MNIFGNLGLLIHQKIYFFYAIDYSDIKQKHTETRWQKMWPKDCYNKTIDHKK